MESTKWHVRFGNGKWDVEEYDEFRKRIFFEEEEPTEVQYIMAVAGGSDNTIEGVVWASCENDAVMTACNILRDMYSEANRAPLPIVSY